MTIELDVSAPWEPPPPPRRARSWPVVLAIALATLASLSAAVRQEPAKPVFEVDHDVLSVEGAGGRLFVGRYVSVGGDARLTAYRTRDGAELWTAPIEVKQHFAYATADVLALSTAWEDGSGPASTVSVYDAATGDRLWERDAVQVMGRYGGLMVVEDLSHPETRSAPPNRAGEDVDVNPEPARRLHRYRGIDERTGGTAWTVDVPPGTAAEFLWAHEPGYRLTGFTELDPAGVLRHRDLATGAVTDTHRLRFAGAISSYSVGPEPPAEQVVRPAYVLVYAAGQRGADVFDRSTGERLWHWEGDRFDWLFPCAPDRLCGGGEQGLDLFDARTGRRQWSLDRYANTMGYGDRVLVLGRFPGSSSEQDNSFAVVDVATGRILRTVEGWRVLRDAGGRLVVWRPTGPYSAVLATVDPATGDVTVFGRSAEWYGSPDCTVSEGSLACVVVGRLSVWRLPVEPSA